MVGVTDEQLAQALALWQAGETVEAGRVIFERVPEDARPAWAAGILRAIIARTGISSAAIEGVLQVVAGPWSQAHQAFDAARDESFKLEKVSGALPTERLPLRVVLLAELVAKVTYNATKPDDEFDEDSGWWIGSCLREVLEAAGDPDPAGAAWALLTSDPD